MPRSKLLSPAQQTFLFSLPDSSDERLIAGYYTLSERDLAIINRHRRAENRLGFALQLCYLRYPGRKWGPQEAVPPHILNYVAQQLGVETGVVRLYAQDRPATRLRHLEEIQAEFGFQPFSPDIAQAMSEWLLLQALRTDQGQALLLALIEELRRRRIILPALSTLERLGWEVRQKARQITFTHLTAGLTSEQETQLDQVLELRAETNLSYLNWLNQAPEQASPAAFSEVVARLTLIRHLKLEPKVRDQVHPNRLRQLAHETKRLSAWRLGRFDDLQRRAMLVAFLLEMSATLTDQALDMHDRLVGQMFKRSENQQARQFLQEAKVINKNIHTYVRVGKALIAAKDDGSDPYEAITAILPWSHFVDSIAEAETLVRPEDFDYLDLVGTRYSHIRQYSRELWQTFDFEGSEATEPLRQAVQTLRELDAGDARELPASAPTEFIPKRWKSQVVTEAGLSRRYYELCVLSELRNGLRSGDIWVAESRQYRTLESYLLSDAAWQAMREAETIPVAVEVDVETYLQQRQTQLQEQLQTVHQLVAEDKLPEVRLEKGKFHFTRLKTDQPEGMTDLTRRAYALLPPIKITDLLLEVEASTGFSRHFTHLQSGDRVEDKITLLTAILADALNLGLSKMAAASPEISYRRLAWMADWYIREETYSRALTELVNFHHRLAFSSHWGDGTTSSSDGQHFPVGGIRSALARTNVYYGTEPGVMFYTHLSDQYDPFYVKVISTTVRQASYALDGLLYHETDLAIQEHYTDTLGYTDHVFALCHLLGFRFAPRIRQFNHQRLYIFEKASTYPQLQAHIGGRIEVDLVRQEWDNILRLASSVRSGTVTASLILQRLSSYPRQPRLGRALREVGRLERTFFALDWLQSSTLRQRVFLGLQKGEARNSLARAVFLHRLGKVQDRSFENQSYRASGLNLVIAAIALWNTVYLERAVEQLKADGMEITEEQLRHLSPLGWGHINLTGDYVWNRQQTTSLEHLRALATPTQSS